MAEMTEEILARYGLRRYEISNYAKEGFACRHNVGYWTGVPYLGLGLGASSYLPAELFATASPEEVSSAGVLPEDAASKDSLPEAAVLQEGRIGGDARSAVMLRLRGTDSLSEYLKLAGSSAVREVTEALSIRDMESEFMILGLRMTAGISENDFASRFGRTADSRFGPVLDRHLRDGLLQRRGGRIALTARGLSLANVVMRDFLD